MLRKLTWSWRAGSSADSSLASVRHRPLAASQARREVVVVVPGNGEQLIL